MCYAWRYGIFPNISLAGGVLIIQKPPSLSFTTTSSGGLLNVLTNQCGITQAFAIGGAGIQAQPQPFMAIWDTGATASVITQEVVAACGLKATGMTRVHHVQGTADAETYLVNIYLPNRVVFPTMRVTKGDLTGGANILIGMDIMSQGDFAVTNFQGLTKFTFRVPSQLHLDFVEEYNRKQGLLAAGGSRPPIPRPRHSQSASKKRTGRKKR